MSPSINDQVQIQIPPNNTGFKTSRKGGVYIILYFTRKTKPVALARGLGWLVGASSYTPKMLRV